MAAAISRRKYLVDGLYEAIPPLQRALAASERQRNALLFLQQLIVQHVDDDGLERILAAIKQEIAAAEGAVGPAPGSAHGRTELPLPVKS